MELMAEYIAFLNQHCPKSPELDNIKLIICNSIDVHYPDKDYSQKNQDDEK